MKTLEFTDPGVWVLKNGAGGIFNPLGGKRRTVGVNVAPKVGHRIRGLPCSHHQPQQRNTEADRRFAQIGVRIV